MNKFLQITFLFTLPFTTGFAQNALSYSQKSEMVNASQSMLLGSEVLISSKQYATQNGYDYKIIEKNVVHIKIIYNERLAVENRIAYCNYLLELWTRDNSSLPKPIIIRKKKLLEQLKSGAND